MPRLYEANVYAWSWFEETTRSLVVSLNMRDILDSRKWRTITDGPTYHMESERKGGGRRLNFTVSYSFGNMRAKKPKIKKEDASTGSGYEDMGGGEE